jgi:hypothetical protein
MPSTRNTFVISVRDQDGPATVEEVRSGRKARLSSLRDTAGQIERWLREPRPTAPSRTERGR